MQENQCQYKTMDDKVMKIGRLRPNPSKTKSHKQKDDLMLLLLASQDLVQDIHDDEKTSDCVFIIQKNHYGNLYYGDLLVLSSFMSCGCILL